MGLCTFGVVTPKGHSLLNSPYVHKTIARLMGEFGQQQALTADVYDAVKTFLYKTTKISSSLALVELTAGIFQLISSSIAIRKSSSWETALHIVSIVTAVCSIACTLIQGITVPVVVSKLVSDMQAACVGFSSAMTSMFTQTTTAAPVTPQSWNTTVTTVSPPTTISTPIDPLTSTSTTSTTPLTTSASVPITTSSDSGSVTNTTVASTASETVTTTTAAVTSPIVTSAVEKDVPDYDNALTIDHFPRNYNPHEQKIHYCGPKCKLTIKTKSDTDVVWYKCSSHKELLATIFPNVGPSLGEMATVLHDYASLTEHAGLSFYNIGATSVEGCTANTVFYMTRGDQDYIGLTSDFLQRSSGPGLLYTSDSVDKFDWCDGVQGIYVTGNKTYWNPRLLLRYPTIAIQPYLTAPNSGHSDTLTYLFNHVYTSRNDAKAALEAAAYGDWIGNAQIKGCSLKSYPNKYIFLTEFGHSKYSTSRDKLNTRAGSVIVYPMPVKQQSIQDWSKVCLCVLSIMLGALGMGFSPHKKDFLRWIAAANQSAALTKNLSHAQDFITTHLLDLETQKDDLIEDRFNKLCTEVDNILAVPVGLFLTRLDLLERLVQWPKDFRTFLRESKDNKSKAVSWYVRTLSYKDQKISELWVEVNKCFNAVKDRTPCVLVELIGSPGIGKTTAISQFIIPELAKRMGDVPTECYQLQIAHNGHFSDYNGQLFARYDEFRAEGGKDPFFHYINHMASPGPMLIEGPFVKDRNFQARFCFLTSNSGKTSLDGTFTEEAATAIESRIHQYRMKHPEAERLMKAHQTRDVVCDRAPNTYEYYRIDRVYDDTTKKTNLVEVQITYEAFIQDCYIMAWQQHNAHPPPPVDQELKDMLENWTGRKDVTFDKKAIQPRVHPRHNDVIPELKVLPVLTRVPHVPVTVPTQQSGSDHFVVHIHGPPGRGKTYFYDEVSKSLPGLMRTKICKIDLTNKDTWKNAIVYWIDDQVIAYQQEYLDFYNTRTTPSVIMLSSNIKTTPYVPPSYIRLANWWAGRDGGRCLPEIKIEGLRRRLGLNGTLHLDGDQGHSWTAVGTNLEGYVSQPGVVVVDGSQLTVNKFILELGKRIRKWRDVNILYDWGDSSNVTITPDPDIRIAADDIYELKRMLKSASSMWSNFGSTPSSKIFVKPALASKLTQKDEICVEFWKIHDSTTIEDLDEIVKSIFVLYRQVDLDSSLVVTVGKVTYWNIDHTLYKRGAGDVTLTYKDCEPLVELTFTEKSEGSVYQQVVSLKKSELIHVLCEGSVYSAEMMSLRPSFLDIFHSKMDLILSDPMMTPYVKQHYAYIQDGWKRSCWEKFKRKLKLAWEEHPYLLISVSVISIWIAWSSLMSLYTKAKEYLTNSYEFTCTHCGFIHKFTKDEYEDFVTEDYNLCPHCCRMFPKTNNGEYVNIAMFDMQISRWKQSHWSKKMKDYCSQQSDDSDFEDGPAVHKVTPEYVALRQERLRKTIPSVGEASRRGKVSKAFGFDWADMPDFATTQGADDPMHNVISVVRKQMGTAHGAGKTRALGIGKRYFACPSHVWTDDGINIQFQGKYYSTNLVYLNTASDLCIVEIVNNQFPLLRNLTKYMVSSEQLGKVSSGALIIDSDDGYNAIHGMLEYDSHNIGYLTQNDDHVYENVVALRSVSMGCGGMSPKDGDCSNIYVAKNGSAQCLVGIHVSFNPYQAKAYGSALVRDQIEIILAEYETNLTQSEELTTAKIELPYGTYLASPDVVEYFGKHVKPVPGNVIVPEARCVNLGSASRTLHKRKAAYFKTPYSHEISEIMPIAKIPVDSTMKMVKNYDGLKHNRKGFYCQLTTQMANCDKTFTGSGHTLDIAEAEVLEYLRTYYPGPFKELNQHDVLNGIPGLSPVTLDTGCGVIAQKMHKITLKGDAIRRNPEGVLQFATSVQGEALRSLYKHETSLFRQGHSPLYVFSGQLKTECLPREKAHDGKIRLYAVGPVGLMLQERRLCGSLAAAVASTNGPIFIGKDPMLYFDTFLPKCGNFSHHIDVDCKRWDKNLPPAVIVRGLRIISELYPPELKKEFIALFNCISYPVMQLDETLVQVDGSLASGIYLTSLLGSICHTLVMAYAMKTAHPFRSVFQDAQIMTCGDDGVYLHSDPTLQVDEIIQGYIECGIATQHPDKDGKPIESEPLSVPIQFCGRIVRYRDGHWIPALNLTSALASLHYSKEKSVIGLSAMLSATEFETYAFLQHDYEFARRVLKIAWKALGKTHRATSLPLYPDAHNRLLKFMKGVFKDREQALTGYSSSSAEITNVKTSYECYDDSLIVSSKSDLSSIAKSFQQSDHHGFNMSGSDHPRTIYLQNCQAQKLSPQFDERITCTGTGYKCTLCVEGTVGYATSENYADVARKAWDNFPIPQVNPTTETLPAAKNLPPGQHHPKSQYNEWIAKDASIPKCTEKSVFSKAGWTCTLSNKYATVERTAANKQTASHAAWTEFLPMVRAAVAANRVDLDDKFSKLNVAVQQMDSMGDAPRIAGGAMPISDSKGTDGLLVAKPFHEVPSEWIAHSGTTDDILTMCQRTMWSAAVNVSKNDTPGTVLFSLGWADNANWAVNSLMSMHKYASGAIFCTIQVVGSAMATGLLRMGVLLTDVETPTINDLAQVQNASFAVNETQTITFRLPFIGKEPYANTDSLPTVPKIVCLTETVLANTYDSAGTLAILRVGWDADDRTYQDGKYFRTGLGLSLNMSLPVPPVASPSRSFISGSRFSMRSIFPSETRVHMYTDGRKSGDWSVDHYRPIPPSDGSYVEKDSSFVPYLDHLTYGSEPTTLIETSNPTQYSKRGFIGRDTADKDWIQLSGNTVATLSRLTAYVGNVPRYAGDKVMNYMSLYGLPTLGNDPENVATVAQNKNYGDLQESTHHSHSGTMMLKLSARNVKYTKAGTIPTYETVDKIDIIFPCEYRVFPESTGVWYRLHMTAADITSAAGWPTGVPATAIFGQFWDGTPSTGGNGIATDSGNFKQVCLLSRDMTSLPIATTGDSYGPTMPEGWVKFGLTNVVPRLVTYDNGDMHQPSIFCGHQFKRSLIEHTNAVDGDVLQFQLVQPDFSDSVASVRMYVKSSVSSSYMCIKADDPYMWGGDVIGTYISNLIKVAPSASMSKTSQLGWASLMLSHSSQVLESLRPPPALGIRELADLLLTDPHFRACVSKLPRAITQMEDSKEKRRGTRADYHESRLGRNFGVRAAETRSRLRTLEIYSQYKRLSGGDRDTTLEFAGEKFNCEMSDEAQVLLKRMQKYLCVQRDTQHDERLGESKFQQHMANTNCHIVRSLENIENKLTELTNVLEGSRVRTPPVHVAVGSQAGLPSYAEVTNTAQDPFLPRAIQQAEIAMYALGGAGMGIGDAMSKRADRKLARERMANMSDIQGMKGEQAIKQIKTQGAINGILQNRQFSNQLRMAGVNGEQRLGLAKYNKTGVDPTEPKTKDAQTQKVTTRDQATGRSSKDTKGKPKGTSATATGSDESIDTASTSTEAAPREYAVNEGASTSGVVPSQLKIAPTDPGLPQVLTPVSHA